MAGPIDATSVVLFLAIPVISAMAGDPERFLALVMASIAAASGTPALCFAAPVFFHSVRWYFQLRS